ncbi:MAG: sporulation protein YtfJ [Clostridia bacterium]|nr:sporulation protein YtfJ [Clostridia bacterium]
MKEERHISKKIESLIDSSLERVKSLIDVNCVIGEPLTMPDGSTILPISKVTMGFVCGGGEYNDLSVKRLDDEYPMAGGIGGGFSVNPIGFFVVQDKKYKLIPTDKTSMYTELLKNASMVVKKIVEEKADEKK